MTIAVTVKVMLYIICRTSAFKCHKMTRPLLYIFVLFCTYIVPNVSKKCPRGRNYTERLSLSTYSTCEVLF